MKNILHNKVWITDTNPSHVKPPPIPLNKETSTGRSYEYYIKLKLRRDPMSSTSDLDDFRMSLFDHGRSGKFLLFICKFNMAIATKGTLETHVKV